MVECTQCILGGGLRFKYYRPVISKSAQSWCCIVLDKTCSVEWGHHSLRFAWSDVLFAETIVTFPTLKLLCELILSRQLLIKVWSSYGVPFCCQVNSWRRTRQTDRRTDGRTSIMRNANSQGRVAKRVWVVCNSTSAQKGYWVPFKVYTSNRCLHPLLPPDRTLNQVLRTRGHSFQLPTCSFNLHKKSFVCLSF